MILKGSIYNIRANNYIFSDEEDILKDFYEPIIGSKSIRIYLELKNQLKEHKENILFDSLLESLNIDISSINRIIKILVSIGLIELYSNDENSNHIFALNGVLTPKEFLNNKLLYKTLNSCIGDRINALEEKYDSNIDYDEYKKIEYSFEDEFSVVTNRNDEKNPIRREGRIDAEYDFNLDLLFNEAKKHGLQISEKIYSLEEKETIKSLCVFYNAHNSYFATATALFESTNSKTINNNVVYIFDKDTFEKKLRNICVNHTQLKRKEFTSLKKDLKDKQLDEYIKYCESMSATQFLGSKQPNGSAMTLGQGDIYLLSRLHNMGLSDGGINVLIDYCLDHNNNTLANSYVTKIAGTLLRRGAVSALAVYSELYAPRIVKQNGRYVEEEQAKKILAQSSSQVIDDDDDEFDYEDL